jgi:hypothetical protein
VREHMCERATDGVAPCLPSSVRNPYRFTTRNSFIVCKVPEVEGVAARLGAAWARDVEVLARREQRLNDEDGPLG